MKAAHPFRRLLTLVALIMPATFATCRTGIAPEADKAGRPAASEVVFRHYL